MPGAAEAPEPAPAYEVAVPYPVDVPYPAPPPAEDCPKLDAVEFAIPEAVVDDEDYPDYALAAASTYADDEALCPIAPAAVPAAPEPTAEP